MEPYNNPFKMNSLKIPKIIFNPQKTAQQQPNMSYANPRMSYATPTGAGTPIAPVMKKEKTPADYQKEGYDLAKAALLKTKQTGNTYYPNGKIGKIERIPNNYGSTPQAPTNTPPQTSPQTTVPQEQVDGSVKLGAKEYTSTNNMDLSKMTSTELEELKQRVNTAYDTKKNVMGSGADLMTLPNLTGQQGLVTNQQNTELDRINSSLNTQKEVEAQARAERLAAIRASGDNDKEELSRVKREDDSVEKISLIDSLLANKGGLKASVGSRGLGRRGIFRKGKMQLFGGDISQLTSGLTLSELIEAKKAGATFGALTDGERITLANAATKLGRWEIKDKNGLPTGKFAAKEKDVTAEINKIRDMALRDYERATGNSYQSQGQGGVQEGSTQEYQGAVYKFVNGGWEEQ